MLRDTMEPAAAPRALQALCEWIAVSPRRESVLVALRQPLTAVQLAGRLGCEPGPASYCFWELSTRGVTRCLNPAATNNRLHWLTGIGRACRDRLIRAEGLPPTALTLPELDWPLYGELLFRHRAAVLRAMNGPRQPSEIRRLAVDRQSGLRMSANNVRDVVRFLVEKKVAAPVDRSRAGHKRYALTETGLAFKQLLLNAIG